MGLGEFFVGQECPTDISGGKCNPARGLASRLGVILGGKCEQLEVSLPNLASF